MESENRKSFPSRELEADIGPISLDAHLLIAARERRCVFFIATSVRLKGARGASRTILRITLFMVRNIRNGGRGSSDEVQASNRVTVQVTYSQGQMRRCVVFIVNQRYCMHVGAPPLSLPPR